MVVLLHRRLLYWESGRAEKSGRSSVGSESRGRGEQSSTAFPAGAPCYQVQARGSYAAASRAFVIALQACRNEGSSATGRGDRTQQPNEMLADARDGTPKLYWVDQTQYVVWNRRGEHQNCDDGRVLLPRLPPSGVSSLPSSFQLLFPALSFFVL